MATGLVRLLADGCGWTKSRVSEPAGEKEGTMREGVFLVIFAGGGRVRLARVSV
jgi:hypothetical protein